MTQEFDIFGFSGARQEMSALASCCEADRPTVPGILGLRLWHTTSTAGTDAASRPSNVLDFLGRVGKGIWTGKTVLLHQGAKAVLICLN